MSDGTIKVNVIAEAGQFLSTIKQVEGATGGVKTSLGSVGGMSLGSLIGSGAAIGAGFGIATTAINAFSSAIGAVKDSVTEQFSIMDDATDMAEKFGITTASLSQLDYAAKLTGNTVDGVATAMQKMTSVLDDAQGGSKEAQASFEKMGIRWQELIGLPLDEQLKIIADGFANTSSSATRLNGALDLFGKGNTDIVRMMKLGSAGLEEFAQKANAAGYTLWDTSNVADMNDSIDEMKMAWAGIGRTLATEVAPAVKVVVDAMATGIRGINSGLHAIGFGTTANPYMELMRQRESIQAAQDAYAINEAKKQQAKLEKEILEQQKQQASIQKSLRNSSRSVLDDMLTMGLPDKEKEIEKARLAHYKSYEDNPNAKVSIQEIENSWKIQEGMLRQRQAMQEQLDKQKQLGDEAKKLKEDLASPYEKAAKEIERINEMMRAGLITVDQYNMATDKTIASATKNNLPPAVATILAGSREEGSLRAQLERQNALGGQVGNSTDKQQLQVMRDQLAVAKDTKKAIEKMSDADLEPAPLNIY